jgi:hypothetical protein
MYWTIPHFFDVVRHLPEYVVRVSKSKDADEHLATFCKYISKMLYSIHDKTQDASKLSDKLKPYFVGAKHEHVIEALHYVFPTPHTDGNIMCMLRDTLCMVHADQSVDDYFHYARNKLKSDRSTILHFPGATKRTNITALIHDLNGLRRFKVRAVLCFTGDKKPLVVKCTTFMYTVYSDMNTYKALEDSLHATPTVIYLEAPDCPEPSPSKRKEDEEDDSSSSDSPIHQPRKGSPVPIGQYPGFYVSDAVVFALVPHLENALLTLFHITTTDNIRRSLFLGAKHVLYLVSQYVPQTQFVLTNQQYPPVHHNYPVALFRSKKKKASKKKASKKK